MLVIALTAVSGAVAEPAFSFDATPGKLPKTVVPIHYAIELKPNLETLALAGSEVVDIEVREPTARLVLNAENMTLSSATIDEAQSARIAAPCWSTAAWPTGVGRSSRWPVTATRAE